MAKSPKVRCNYKITLRPERGEATRRGVPALPGCVTYERTADDAAGNGDIYGYIASLRKADRSAAFTAQIPSNFTK
jgi:hypothetical protein